MQKLSVIIPIFNEEKNLEILLSEIYETLNNKFIFEIVAVDDCSTDSSLIILNKLSKESNLKIIRNFKNEGQSFSIYKGVKNSKYNNILTIDADLQNNPIDILELANYFFNSNYKLVGGIRKNRKDNFIKIISSRIANKLRNLILDDNCSDTGCSLKIFSKKIFLEFPYFRSIHRFLPALFRGYGYKTYFINVSHRPRINGVSKYGTLDRLFIGIYDIFRVYKIVKKYKKNLNV